MPGQFNSKMFVIILPENAAHGFLHGLQKKAMT